MTDLEEEMEETTERASALGVSGGDVTDPDELLDDGDDSDQTDETDSETQPETDETSDLSTRSEALETSEATETVESDEAGSDSRDADRQEPGGLHESTYPNPDKELGSLIDTYDNFNVYVPPEVKQEVNSFFKQLDFEYSQEHGEDLDKHWDFYTALFRAVLQNREIVEEELGLEN